MIEIKYWVWLSLCVPPGSKAGDLLLLNWSADAKAIYEADEEEYGRLEGLDPKVLRALLDKDLSEAEEVIDICVKNNIGILPYDSPNYPSRLRRIERAPILLYYRGKLIDFDDNVEIAAVGTRSYTEYGRREAYRLCRDMAIGGAIIVSGMARGIDGFCHRAALDVRAHTVAVLGCGINKVYPPEHEGLMNEIIASGTVLSEFRPYTDPIGSNFPIRNRIISGLSLGTLVIEADQRSGALITARYALKQGRDIFALPGKVGDANSLGTNELIQKGAKMVQNAEDILGEYEFFYPHRISIDKLPRFSRFQLSPFKKKPFSDVSRLPDPAAEKSGGRKRGRGNSDAPAVAGGRACGENPPSAVEFSAELTPADQLQAGENAVKSTDKVQSAENPSVLGDYSAFKLSAEQESVLLKLEPGVPTLPDALTGEELPVSKVLSALTMLEIKGLAEKVPGGKFVRLK